MAGLETGSSASAELGVGHRMFYVALHCFHQVHAMPSHFVLSTNTFDPPDAMLYYVSCLRETACLLTQTRCFIATLHACTDVLL